MLFPFFFLKKKKNKLNSEKPKTQCFWSKGRRHGGEEEAWVGGVEWGGVGWVGGGRWWWCTSEIPVNYPCSRMHRIRVTERLGVNSRRPRHTPTLDNQQLLAIEGPLRLNSEEESEKGVTTAKHLQTPPNRHLADEQQLRNLHRKQHCLDQHLTCTATGTSTTSSKNMTTPTSMTCRRAQQRARQQPCPRTGPRPRHARTMGICLYTTTRTATLVEVLQL